MRFGTDRSTDKRAFSRLETDDEFRTRVGVYWTIVGTNLDDHIWVTYKKQRRIVWVYA